MARALLALLVLGLLLLGIAKLGGGTADPAPRAVAVVRKPPVQAPLPPEPARPAVPATETQFAARPTPAIDLLVKLEARRRLLRAGSAVYLDSMLLTSDSMVRRWPDRPGNPIQVYLAPQPSDSTPSVGPRPHR